MSTPVAVLLPAILAAWASQDPTNEALRERLESALDAGTASERRQAALELAKLEVPLGRWLDLLRNHAPPRNLAPRTGQVVVLTPGLNVASTVERTPIHVYVPASLDPTNAAPLLLAFHGTGGDGRGLPGMWKDVAESLGMIVAAPDEVGPNEGYRFRDRERQSALETIRFLRRTFHVDPRRIHLTGISRGGHLAWDLALRQPHRFASIAPMIGGPRLNIAEGQNNLRFVENVTELPIVDLQGALDDPRLVFNVRIAFSRLEKLGARAARLVEFPELGHSFDLGAVDWEEHFLTHVRPGRPRRIVHTLARLEEGRNAWIEVTRLGSEVEYEFRPEVKRGTWEKLDDEGRRTFLLDEAIERNARLEIEMVEPGRFVAKGRGVQAFDLWLEPDMFRAEEPIRVTFQRRTRKLSVTPSREVLLEAYVRDLDPTFLPVAKVTVR